MVRALHHVCFINQSNSVMISASEARSKSSGVEKLMEKCEERILEQVNGGTHSAVVFGVTDYTTEEGIEEVQSKLSEEGYDVEREGVNLFVQW